MKSTFLLRHRTDEFTKFIDLTCPVVQAITRFIKYADVEETVPDVKGKSPKYSTYAFTDGEWTALGLILEVLNVCDIY